jgi:hypothetical protein
MKLNEITSQQLLTLNSKSEQEQLEAIMQRGSDIEFIDNPSEAVQLAAVRIFGWYIMYIKNPCEAAQLSAVRDNGVNVMEIKHPLPSVIKSTLTNPEFVLNGEDYRRVVKRLFADNNILMKKWLRYGETMRNQI